MDQTAGVPVPLEPLPETRRAMEAVGRWSEADLLRGLMDQGEQVQRLVPSCVGLSLTVAEGGVTFTLVSSSPDVTLLDGVQYAVGGPCVDAVATDETIHGGDEDGFLAEERWADFARASARHGVRSTLSMPIHHGGHLVGGVNLYAAEAEAFRGKAEDVAAVLGAWAPDAVSNADLTFSSRESATHALEAIDAESTLGQAMGVVMAGRGVDRETARGVIAEAARRSGGDELDIARAILLPHVGPDSA
ncbi:GAF domain-containing protein [Oryzobacter terrae]|uniref:GAF domain-containing protein n=1 Tax=Oryzobacter terrae TaxID=1620385 RepID=UPI00366FBB80